MSNKHRADVLFRRLWCDDQTTVGRRQPKYRQIIAVARILQQQIMQDAGQGSATLGCGVYTGVSVSLSGATWRSEKDKTCASLTVLGITVLNCGEISC